MGTWIADYLEYMAEQETPEILHKFAAITSIAAALERKVWLDRVSKSGIKYYSTRPGAMYTVLVGGAGVARKTTAVNFAEDIMREAGIRTYSGTITPERLLAKLASFPDKRAVMTVVAGEMTAFLNRQKYNEYLTDVLNKLYDMRDDAYETQNNQFQLQDVCLTMLLATTPKSLANNVPTAAHQTGFMSRFLWVYADPSGRKEPLSNSDINHEAAARMMIQRDRLVTRLKDVRNINGPFYWDKTAQDKYNDWYFNFEQDEGWKGRKHEYLAKLMMIMATSARMENIVRGQDFDEAFELIETHVEGQFSKTFSFVGTTASVEQMGAVCDAIAQHLDHKMEDKQLLKMTLKLFKNLTEYRECMEGLRSMGCIKVAYAKADGEQVWELIEDPF